MPEPIAQLTMVMLTLAALVFLIQVVRQKIAGQFSASSFSIFLMAVLIGWMATEVLSDATGQTLGEFARITHFGVMVIFATAMTLQLRRSTVG